MNLCWDYVDFFFYILIKYFCNMHPMGTNLAMIKLKLNKSGFHKKKKKIPFKMIYYGYLIVIEVLKIFIIHFFLFSDICKTQHWERIISKLCLEYGSCWHHLIYFYKNKPKNARNVKQTNKSVRLFQLLLKNQQVGRDPWCM